MNRVAFIFSRAPHGTSQGREALDAVLATAALSDEIALFFIGDGVLQLLADQQPETILARNYVATFGVLPLYDIEQIYLCQGSAAARGLQGNQEWVLPVELLSPELIRQRLSEYDKIINL